MRAGVGQRTVLPPGLEQPRSLEKLDEVGPLSEGRYGGLLVPAQPDLAAEGFPCRGWLVLAPLLLFGFTLRVNSLQRFGFVHDPNSRGLTVISDEFNCRF